MLLHPGNVAKDITYQADAYHPQHRTAHVKQCESHSVHVSHPGYKRREGANERKKARGNDGDAAVFFVESMRLVIRAAVEPAVVSV